MSDSSIQLAANEPKALDAEKLLNELLRLRIQIGGALLAELAKVTNAEPAGNAYGLTVRPVGGKSSAADVTNPDVVANQDTQVLDAEASRVKFSIQNFTDKVLYLKLGTGASATSWTAILAPKDGNGVGGYYDSVTWKGPVNYFVPAGAVGKVSVTEELP